MSDNTNHVSPVEHKSKFDIPEHTWASDAAHKLAEDAIARWAPKTAQDLPSLGKPAADELNKVTKHLVNQKVLPDLTIHN